MRDFEIEQLDALSIIFTSKFCFLSSSSSSLRCRQLGSLLRWICEDEGDDNGKYNSSVEGVENDVH